jgi:hypothetical protein
MSAGSRRLRLYGPDSHIMKFEGDRSGSGNRMWSVNNRGVRGTLDGVENASWFEGGDNSLAHGSQEWWSYRKHGMDIQLTH